MATHTTYYNLTKPSPNDKVNIGVLNDNADIIDTALHNKVNNDDTQNITTSANKCMLSDDVTSVEDRLDANDFSASFIDITSQTTGAYTAPSDGYLYLDAHATTTTIITANVYGSVSSANIRLTASFVNGNTYNSLFIRKGMRVNIVTNNGSGKAYFVALQ